MGLWSRLVTFQESSVLEIHLQYRSKLLVHVHAVIPHRCRLCVPQNYHGTTAVGENRNRGKNKSRGRLTAVICRKKGNGKYCRCSRYRLHLHDPFSPSSLRANIVFKEPTADLWQHPLWSYQCHIPTLQSHTACTPVLYVCLPQFSLLITASPTAFILDKKILHKNHKQLCKSIK